MIFLICFLIIQIFISLQVLAVVTPTFLQGCVLLQNKKIYCFGGATESVNIYNNFKPTNQFISLNVSNPLTFEEANDHWETISLPTNYDLEPRAEFVSATVDNSKKWIIESGAGKGNQYLEPTLTNISLCFDMETNQWSTLQPNVSASLPGINSDQNIYTPAAFQLHGASSATFQNNVSNDILTYGGLRMGNSPLDYRNLSSFSVTRSSKDRNWQEVDAMGFDTPGIIQRGFRSQIVVINETLYAIGGFTYNTTVDKVDTSSKDTIEKTSQAGIYQSSLKYNLTDGVSNESLYNSASIFPALRFWHSFTHVPGTNNILLYGGINIGNNIGIDIHGVCDDYFYKFDTVTIMWESITFDAKVGPGKRYGHSAIINDNILYILFGANEAHVLQNSVHMLNLTSMSWIEAMKVETSSSLSPGAIAGISIGSIVAGSLLIGTIIFYVIRRKRIQGYQPPEKPEFLNHNNTFIKNSNINIEDEDEDEDNVELSSYVDNNDNNNSSDNNLLYPKPTLASDNQDEINYRELGIKPNDSNELLNKTYTTYPSKPGIYGNHQDITYHRLAGIKPGIDDHPHSSSSSLKASSSNHSIVLQLKQPEHSVKPTLD